MIDATVSEYLSRFLPADEKEWRQRVAELLSSLRGDFAPCSGVLMIRTDRGTRCCIGGVMTLAANNAMPFGRWYAAEQYHPDASPNLLQQDEAAQTWRFHATGRPREVAYAADERLTHHSCDTPPEALFYHGVNVSVGDAPSVSPVDDLTDGALRLRLPDPTIREDWKDLAMVNDDLMRKGLNPLDELANALEQGVERMGSVFWHPVVHGWRIR